MLKLLLDEHIPSAVARHLRRRRPALAVRSLAEWAAGEYLGRDDASCLAAAAAERLTLVTYDCRTIPPLLRDWAEAGRSHGGVILVDGETIVASAVGTLGEALRRLAIEAGDWDWTDRVVYLRRF